MGYPISFNNNTTKKLQKKSRFSIIITLILITSIIELPFGLNNSTNQSVLNGGTTDSDNELIVSEDLKYNTLSDAPKSAADWISLESDNFLLKFDDKFFSYWESDPGYGMMMDGVEQSWTWQPYVSINDSSLWGTSLFIINEELSHLTDPDDLTIPQFITGEIQHPEYPMKMRVYAVAYPEQQFFTINFFLNSTMLSADIDFRLEWDIDVDDSYNNDNAFYDATRNLVYGEDFNNGFSVGYSTPIDYSAWDVGTDIDAGSMLNRTSVNKNDIGLATQHVNTSVDQYSIWALPFLYGYGSSDTELFTVTGDLNDYLLEDVAVVDQTFQQGVDPNITSSIVNLGTTTQTRTVYLFSNGTEIKADSITLQPGELQNITFTNLGLDSGFDYNFSVQLESHVNDFALNDINSEITHYNNIVEINLNDFDGNSLSNANVSFHYRSNDTLIYEDTVNSMGIAYYLGELPNEEITLRAYSLWYDRTDQIFEQNYTAGEITNFVEVNTSVVTKTFIFRDVEDKRVGGIDVEFRLNDTNEIYYQATTGLLGKCTILALMHGYNLNYSYSDYGQVAFEQKWDDYNINSSVDVDIAVPITRLTLQFLEKDSLEYLDGAKVEIYNKTSDVDYGDLIGFEIVSIFGNVSITWSSLMNYSLRVIFFGQYKTLNGTNQSAFENSINYTNVGAYVYDTCYVDLVGSIDQFTTEIILQTTLPVVKIWGQNLSVDFMFNVTNTGGGGGDGPAYADYTNVSFYDEDLNWVCSYSAENVLGEIGNHSLLINTTYTSLFPDSPATYTVTINALQYGFPTPDEISFTIRLYNISTSLTLLETESSVVWGDFQTISAYYYDLSNSRPIVDATITVEWSSILTGAIMTNHNNGTYTFSLNSSLGEARAYLLNIEASQMNLTAQTKKYNLEITRVPTLVNNTPIFDSSFEKYVSIDNLLLEYEFMDVHRNIPVLGIEPSYYIINQDTSEQFDGVLEYQDGKYVLDPHIENFQIGDYSGVIEFSKLNYESSFATFKIEIYPIPTSLNTTGLSILPYDVIYSQDLNIDFQLSNIAQDLSLAGADLDFTMEEITTNLTYSGTLGESVGGIYQFAFNSVAYPLGTYRISISSNKVNYTSSEASFVITTREIPMTSVVSGLVSSSNFEVFSNTFSLISGDSLKLHFSLDDNWDSPVDDVDFSFTFSINEINQTCEVIALENGVYELDFGAISPVGLHRFTYSIQKENYTQIDGSFFIEVVYPEILGIPEPYFLTALVVVGVVSVAAIGYRTIKYAKLPTYIKLIDSTLKAIEKDNDNVGRPIPSKDQLINEKYQKRWEQLDLPTPFKPASGDIKLFIDLYLDATGKVLLEGDALNLVDDLSLYGIDERTELLIHDHHVPREMVVKFNHLIMSYIEKYTKEA